MTPRFEFMFKENYEENYEETIQPGLTEKKDNDFSNMVNKFAENKIKREQEELEKGKNNVKKS